MFGDGQRRLCSGFAGRSFLAAQPIHQSPARTEFEDVGDPPGVRTAACPKESLTFLK
jgi:hypothetical protein